MKACIFVLVLGMALGAQAEPTAAQQAGTSLLYNRSDARRELPQPDLTAAQPDRAAALGIETVGGVLGSAIGFGTVALIRGRDPCGEHLSCTLRSAAAALAAGTVGAAGGTYLAGRLAGTEPSGVGAAIGAVAGAGAIVGLDHVLSGDVSQAGRYAAFALAQGVLSAAGSRIGALLR